VLDAHTRRSAFAYATFASSRFTLGASVLPNGREVRST
jgi:hypothetical protein